MTPNPPIEQAHLRGIKPTGGLASFLIGRLHNDMRQLRRLWRSKGGLKAPSEEKARAMAQHLEALHGHMVMFAGKGLVLGMLLLWLFDSILFPQESEVREVHSAWRAGVIIGSLLIVCIHRWSTAPARSGLRSGLLGLMVAGVAAYSGACLAHLGGIDQSHYYVIYPLSAIIPLAVLGPLLRIGLALSINLGFLAGFFGSVPDHLFHPEVVSTWVLLAGSTSLYVMLGHIVYLLLQSNHLQTLQIAEGRANLEHAAALNHHLLLTALPPEITARLGEGEVPLDALYRDLAVLQWEPLGLDARDPDHVAALKTVRSWLSDAVAERPDIEFADIGESTYVVAGLTDSENPIGALEALGAALVARFPRPGDGAPFSLSVTIGAGQVLAGRHGDRAYLYDPWGTLLQYEPRWPGDINRSQLGIGASP